MLAKPSTHISLNYVISCPSKLTGKFLRGWKMMSYQIVDNIVQTFLTYCHLVVDSDWHVIPYYKVLAVATKLLCSPWLLIATA